MSFVPRYPKRFVVCTNCNSIYKFRRTKRNPNIYKVLIFTRQSRGGAYSKSVQFSSVANLQNVLRVARRSQSM